MKGEKLRLDSSNLRPANKMQYLSKFLRPRGYPAWGWHWGVCGRQSHTLSDKSTGCIATCRHDRDGKPSSVCWYGWRTASSDWVHIMTWRHWKGSPRVLSHQSGRNGATVTVVQKQLCPGPWYCLTKCTMGRTKHLGSATNLASVTDFDQLQRN